MQEPRSGKKPSEGYLEMIGFISKVAGVVGADVYDPTYRMNIRTYFVTILTGTYYCLTTSTIFFQFEEHPNILLEGFAMSNCALTATVKLACFVRSAKTMSDMHFFLASIYQHYEEKGTAYYEVTNKNSRLTQKGIKAILIIFLIPTFLIVVTPLAYHFYDGEHYLVSQFHIPMLDVKTKRGYYITFSLHVLMTVFCGIGFAASDAMIICFMLNTSLLSDLFASKVRDINQLLDEDEDEDEEKGEKDKQFASRKEAIVEKVTDLVKWHQVSLNYIKTISNTFSPVVTTIISSTTVSILLALYISLTSRWPSCYPFLTLCFYSIYVYCFIGTRTEICNDDVCYQIYNVKWYLMTNSQKRTILIMLLRSQTPREILIANVVPLTVKTACGITKNIYSAFAMTLQVIES